MSLIPQTEVAIAILYRDGKFLMQLRDNIPTIVYPGYWTFFGGHIEPGEDSDKAVRRELQEEIGYVPPILNRYRCDQENHVICHVYQGELTVGLEALVLGEGWDMDLLTPAEIERGDRYSVRAAQIRPLGAPHRRILLEFMRQMTLEG